MKFLLDATSRRTVSQRLLDSDTQFMAILWYYFTVFNKNRYFVSVIMAYLSVIDFKQS